MNDLESTVRGTYADQLRERMKKQGGDEGSPNGKNGAPAVRHVDAGLRWGSLRRRTAAEGKSHSGAHPDVWRAAMSMAKTAKHVREDLSAELTSRHLLDESEAEPPRNAPVAVSPEEDEVPPQNPNRRLMSLPAAEGDMAAQQVGQKENGQEAGARPASPARTAPPLPRMASPRRPSASPPAPRLASPRRPGQKSRGTSLRTASESRP